VAWAVGGSRCQALATGEDLSICRSERRVRRKKNGSSRGRPGVEWTLPRTRKRKVLVEKEKEKMKSIISVMSALFLAIPAFAGKVENQGREWLDEHKDSPQVNVTGTWESPDWNTVTLTQAEGSRDVSGTDKKFDLTGVVSGNNLYLLFAHSNGSVGFCATLTSGSDGGLTGMYSYRVTRLKLGHGLCQSKGYRLRMKKSSPAPTPQK
jgi:hypothetical protein